MSIVSLFQAQIRATIETVFTQHNWAISDITRVVLEEPKDSSHGELATNAALVLAKPVGQNPRAVAEALKAEFEKLPFVSTVSIAGAGFINFTMQPEFWHQILPQILQGTHLGDVACIGAGKKVNIEYVSANPTGPMHVGHGRGAVFGDVLANLLAKTGWDVTKEYYINDAGGQIGLLTESVIWRIQEIMFREENKIIGDMPANLYPGDYLIPIAERLWNNKYKHYSDPQNHVHVYEDIKDDIKKDVIQNNIDVIKKIMDLIRDDLAALGVKHDVFFSERSLTRNGENKVEAALELLESQGHIYVGTLAPPKGEIQENYVARPQTLFRATAFGDNEDRAVKKENGDYTYFAADVAYHQDKLNRGFSRLIDVWGADHAGYVSRMKAVVKALSNSAVNLEIALCQLVRLQRNGEPVRMSKRSGEFVTLREVVDEVGKDAVRFMMVYRKADAPLDFDLAKVVEQSKDNPVFYVQYAHARICSVLRLAAEQNVQPLPADKILSVAHLLSDDAEKDLMIACARFAEVVQSAAATTDVHRVAFYVHDLASKFHSLWAKGNSTHSLRVMQADSLEISAARVTLCACVAKILQEALGILGVSAPESM